MNQIAPTTAQLTAEHWTERSGRFNAGASHVRNEQTWREVFRAAVGDAPRAVLDLGTGTGACALLLADLGHSVTAVDGSAGMLGVAREAAEERGLAITFIHATMDDAPLAGGAFDVVTLRNVLWTLEVPEAALRLAKRCLRPGGTLLLADGSWRAPGVGGDQPEFYAALPYADGISEDEARQLLAQEGFDGIRSFGDMFDAHPYAPMGNPAFFVLTATN